MSEVTQTAQDTPKAEETKSDGQAQTETQTQAAPEQSTEAKAPEAEAKVESKVEGEAKVETETKKPEEEKKVVPEKYELKVPEGSQLDASYVEKIASYAKEQGLSNEQAQALLERDSAALADYVKAQHETLEKQQVEWKQQVELDKEIGGQAHRQNVELAHRVLKRFGSEAFLDQLDSTGLGNHPELLRVFVRIGKQMGEDSLVMPGVDGSSTKLDPAQVLYGRSGQ